jgi:DNA polymerase-3 subunit delta'
MSLSEIIGHDYPKSLLGRLLQASLSGRQAGFLPHSYLFEGPDGIGKRRTALEFAKALNCERSGRDGFNDACDECPACHRVNSGNHPDVVQVTASGTFIKIEQTREVQSAIFLKPFMGRKKVYLIDEADRMNQEAANGFLKTLEEPPADSILILITSRPFALLSTIVSRCQRLRFQPLTSAQIEQHLISKRGLTGEDAKMLAAVSLGRLGIALEASVDGVREEIAEFASLLSPGVLQQPVKITEAASHWSTDIETTRKALLWISVWLRDRILFQISPDQGRLLYPPLLGTAPAATINLNRALDCFRFIGEINRALNRNINRQLALEVLLMELDRLNQDNTGAGE